MKLLSSFKPDLIVLGGGSPQLIPERIINLPRGGVINTHPSLLPQFRGTDIHRWQVLNDVKKSGTTIHYIDTTFDTGEILGQKSVDIGFEDTPQKLFEKTAKVAGELMISILQRIENSLPNKVNGEVQEARKDSSRYFSRWRWEDREFLKIDWSKSTNELFKLILASTQESYIYNAPFFFYRKNKIIVREAKAVPCKTNVPPGTVLSISNDGALIKCGCENSALLVTLAQVGTNKGYPEEENINPANNTIDIFKELNINENETL